MVWELKTLSLQAANAAPSKQCRGEEAVAFGRRRVDVPELVEEAYHAALQLREAELCSESKLPCPLQIRKATACLVWSENNDDSLFNLFCEHSMLAGEFLTAS